MKTFLFSLILVSSLFADNLAFITKTFTKNYTNDSAICMATSRSSYVSTSSKILRDFIKVVPNKFSNIKWDYDSLCIHGLVPNKDYTIYLHKDMPLGKLKLDKDYTFTHKSPNYMPSLEFIDNGYIIYSKGDISVPIKSMNVKMLDIALYRINDRNLINVINEYGLMKGVEYYDLDNIANNSGTLLWKKKLPINIKKLNQAQTTAVPIGSSLKKRKPGIYLLQANIDGDDDAYYNTKTQWFLISDIGIFTIKSKKGLHIWCRHLQNSKLYKGVELKLIAKNNEILGTTSAKNGYAFFKSNLLNGTKGMTPKAIYAYSKSGDFNVLNLSTAPLDLTDRGDGGREGLGDTQAMLFSNRDIFKPGSKVDLIALIRDKNTNAKANTHFLLKVYNSKEKEILKKIVTTNDIGSIEESINIDKLSPTGRYRAELFFGDKMVGKFSFLVEDFVPTKIKASFKDIPKIIQANKKIDFKIVAKYLNNTPLSGADIHLTYYAKADKRAFKAYKDYIFGDIDDNFKIENFLEKDLKTNSDGVAKVSFIGNKIFDTTKPISIIYKAEVSELGGRPITKWAKSFYLNRENYIGIKPLFKDDAIDLDDKAKFNIIYLHNTKATAKKLSYKIQEEIVDWNWRIDSKGYWDYYKTYTLGRIVEKGEINVSQKPTLLKLNKLNWGDYKLEISDNNGTISSYIFSSGYEGSRSKTSPDRLPISIDKKSYKVGDTLVVNIKPKFKGPIDIFIANNEILEKKSINSNGKDSIKVSFEVGKNWGSSAYVLATAFRSQSKKLGASRAVGLAHIKIDRSDKIANISLSNPKKVKSKSNIELTVEAKDMANQKAALKISAVDEGILALTNYKIPSPIDYFFAQQRLGLEIKDLYSNIIKTVGEHAEFKVGAGDEQSQQKEMPTQNRRKIVAIFTKDIEFKKGKATTSIKIPDYQGALKLTAIVWNKDKIGYADSEVIVKDDISLEYYMPRFITTGDRVQTLLSVIVDKNVTNGDYKVKLTSDNGVNLEPSSFDISVSKENREFTKAIELSSKIAKNATIKATVYKDGKALAAREFNLAIKNGSIPINSKKLSIVEPNNSIDINSFINKSIYNKISNMHLKVSSQPLFARGSIISDLITYSGRCTEQTTSRAFGLLDSEIANEHKDLITKAIDRLMKYQHMNGSFSLWDGSRQDVWLTAYVVDFLSEAKQRGFKVKQKSINKALDWIEANLNRFSKDRAKKEADIYGLYVLTKNSRVLMSELKVHAQDKSELSTQALAQLGASFMLIGDKTKAQKLFEKAKNALTVSDKYFDHYGGALRDEASLIIRLHEAKDSSYKSEIVNLANMLKGRVYLSTQEMASVLRATAFIKNSASKSFKIAVNGKEITAKNYELKNLDANNLPNIQNLSKQTLWIETSFKGLVNQNYFDKIANNKLSISKTIYTLGGKKADLNNLVQNQKYVVVLSGKIGKNDLSHLLITDYIPSGLELENPDIEGVDTIKNLSWIKGLTYSDHTEYRDDRFTNALNDTSSTSFKSAFVARAVSKGVFVYLPAKIEDMYKSEYRAFSKNTQKTITIKDKANITKTIKTEQNNTKIDTNTTKVLSEQDFLNVSNKKLNKADLQKYKLLELFYLRNAIFAKGGLSFKDSNIVLHNIFKNFSWYSQKSNSGSAVYSSLNNTQKHNVQLILAREKELAGGLVLSDFYRVHSKELDKEYLKRYTKPQLRLLRNSLFARYGLKIKDKKMNKIFQNMPWYFVRNDVNAEQIYNNQMSEIEKHNIKTIKELEH